LAVPAENQTRSVHFGAFELDLRAGELRRNGSRVKLQEQPFRILTMLIEHPGEVVTREELQSKLWPADTFVDFDHSLNAAIRRLRDALGDTAEKPRFVETVARRGYRFLAPVNGATPAASAPQSRRFRYWRLLAVGALLLIGAAGGWLLAHRPHPPAEIKLRRLTANPEGDPVLGSALSPDGRYLAFADRTGFYLREIETGETHPVTLPAGFNAIPRSWYPDGTHLLASWVEGSRSANSLWQISIMGGAPRKLVDDAWLGSVSRDGAQIAFVRNSDKELWVMSGNGENPRQLVAAPMSTFGRPAWSPDGRRIAYVTGTSDLSSWGFKTEIRTLDLGNGRQAATFSLPTANPEEDGNTHLGPALAWMPDNHLVFSISEPPPNQADSNLWALPLDSSGRAAGPAARLTATPDNVWGFTASADGRRIAYAKYVSSPAIYISELSSSGNLSPPQRLTMDEWKDLPFSWTPDGKAILFVSDRDGLFRIFRQEIGQTIPELLVGGREQASIPRLTPDNANIVYVVWPKPGDAVRTNRLMRIPLAGGPPQTVLQRAGIGNMQCARKPSTLCLYDTRSATRLSFFRFDPLTGASQELPQLRIEGEAPYEYQWSLSPDGKTLATVKGESAGNDASIDFYSLEDGSKRTVIAKAWAGITSIDFAADGRSLWAPAHTNTGKWALLSIGLNGRTRVALEDNEMTIGWAIPSPDGKHLALWKARGTSNVWLLEGF
jgi:DNA-binding winged helix-turn-helix (wHTH) protein/Tol biopolymer transport system component